MIEELAAASHFIVNEETCETLSISRFPAIPLIQFQSTTPQNKQLFAHFLFITETSTK